MKKTLLYRIVNTGIIAVFLLLFRVFGPMTNGRSTTESYLLMAVMPFVAAAVSMLVLNVMSRFSEYGDANVETNQQRVKTEIIYNVVCVLVLSLWISSSMFTMRRFDAFTVQDVSYMICCVAFIHGILGVIRMLYTNTHELKLKLDNAQLAMQHHSEMEQILIEKMHALEMQIPNILITSELTGGGKIANPDAEAITSGKRKDIARDEDREKDSEVEPQVRSAEEPQVRYTEEIQVRNSDDQREVVPDSVKEPAANVAESDVVDNEVDAGETVADAAEMVTEDRELLFDSETKESLAVMVSNFVYAKAEGNYTVICYAEDEGNLKTTMLRMKINVVEGIVRDFRQIVRCHRSYIVNLDHVTGRSGRANGMTLMVDDGKDSVPVSRTYSKSMGQRLSGAMSALVCLIVLSVAAGVAYALPTKDVGKVTGEQMYISFMQEIDNLQKDRQPLRAEYVAKAMMEESRRRHDRAGMFFASYELYKLNALRWDSDDCKAYADTMRMMMPDASYQHYIDEVVHDVEDDGVFTVDKADLTLLNKVSALAEAGRYEEAYRLERQRQRRLDSIHCMIADNACQEINIARENDSLSRSLAAQRLAVAEQQTDNARKEAEKSRMAAAVAKIRAEHVEQEMEEKQLKAASDSIKHLQMMEKKQKETDAVRAETERMQYAKYFMMAMLALCGVVLVLIIGTYRRYSKLTRQWQEVNKKMWVAVLLFTMPLMADAQDANLKYTAEFDSLVQKAVALQSDSARLMPVLKQMEIMAEKDNSDRERIEARHLRMIHLTQFSHSPELHEQEVVNLCEESIDYIKKRKLLNRDDKITRYYWEIYSYEANFLSKIGKHAECQRVFRNMKADPHLKYSEAGMDAYFDTFSRIMASRGAREMQLRNLDSFLEYQKRNSLNGFCVDYFSRLVRNDYAVEQIPAILKKGYDFSNYDVEKGMFCMELCIGYGLINDREDFYKCYNEWDSIASLRYPIYRNFYNNFPERIWQIKAYKAAFEGDSATANKYIDSLVTKENPAYGPRVGMYVSVILGDYASAYRNVIEGRHGYSRYNKATDFDASMLREFIINERLRNSITAEREQLLALKTKRLKLVRENELLKADSLAMRENVTKAQLRNLEATEEVKRQRNRLVEDQAERTALLAKQERDTARNHRNLLGIITAGMLIVILVFCVSIINQRRLARRIKNIGAMADKAYED